MGEKIQKSRIFLKAVEYFSIFQWTSSRVKKSQMSGNVVDLFFGFVENLVVR